MGFYGGSYDLAVGFSYLCLSLIGSLGNTLTIVVIGRTRRLDNHCTPFLLSLAIGNLLCCLTTMPAVAYTSMLYTPQDMPIGGSPLFCTVLSLELHTLFGVSYVSLAAIAIVRCLVVWTRGNSSWLGRWQLALLLLLTWAIPALLAIPLLQSYGEKRHSGRICAFFCGPSFSKAEELEEKAEREGREEGQEWKVWEVWEVITVTSYPGVPVLIMAVCYYLIFYQMRSSRLLLEECGVLAFNLQRRERNFSRMLSYIFVSHMACTLPAAILHVIDRVPFLLPPSIVPEWMNIVAFILLMTPFATNALIYVVSDPNYRRAYKDTLLCRSTSSGSRYKAWRTSFRLSERETVTNDPFN